MLKNNISCESKEYPFPENYSISEEAINEFESTSKKYISKGYTDCIVSYNGDSFGSRTYTIYLIKGSNSIQVAQYNPNSNDKLINQVSGVYVISPSSEKILKIAYNLRYRNGAYNHIKTAWDFEEVAKYFPIIEQGKNNELEINGNITFSSLPIQNFDNFTGCCQDTLLPPVLGMVKKYFTNLKDRYNPCKKPQPPTPEGEQTVNSSCIDTGQFGGGGTPLKDIKLFLYANKVTKGTITLSKPQVEVGTYATDWRPNPADAAKSIEMMLKQIESVRKGGKKNGKKRD